MCLSIALFYWKSSYADDVQQYPFYRHLAKSDPNSDTPNTDRSGPRQTNLLFIIFDDLRTELSVYGKKHMITPNFERLAEKAVTFEHAYTQVAGEIGVSLYIRIWC